MVHSAKRIKACLALMLLVAASVPSAFGFSLLGPVNEPYQISQIGYNLPGDIGAPKNLGDGYRWNTRTLYYAADSSYSSYFKSNGLAAIDNAFFVMNALTNLSSYSSNLTEWPLNTTRINPTAKNLHLLDVKSITLSLIIEELGLAQPDRYVWTLHNRNGTPIPCPAGEIYTVIQRNFDPITYQYSQFVNGTEYDYQIKENCTGPDPLAVAAEFAVDPTAPSETAVAAGILDNNVISNAISVYNDTYRLGRFYTGLTRDDVGGLRYLMATNRVNVEGVDTNSLLLVTNKLSGLLVTSNLQVLTSQALTNGPTNFQTLYPNIVISSFTNLFSNVVTTNITAFFTNPPLAPSGAAKVVLVTNYDTNVAVLFDYVFANVVTNHRYNKGFVLTQTTNIVFTNGPLAPAGSGSLQTNVTSVLSGAKFVNGDYYVIPTNQFGFDIIKTQLVKTILVTNVVILATNAPGTTNLNGQSFVRNIITFFTNYNYIAYPIDLVTNSVALRKGIDKINFVRQDFDSLVNNFWDPVTNLYSLTAVTNGVPFKQTLQRIITRPDILISAKDQINAPGVPTIINFTSINFNSNNASSDGIGPGTIEAPVQFVYGKVGPLFFNGGGFFQGQSTASFFFNWATFDGTTNAPIVYPDSTSLDTIENMIFFQILSGLLPTGSVSANDAGNPFSAQLQAQGESPPFNWSLMTNSPGLPEGLTLSTNGLVSGVLTNATVGTYDFMVQATDAVGRATQAELVLEVDP